MPETTADFQPVSDYELERGKAIIAKVTEPPLLAIEISSATQSTQELVDKIYAMLRAGVKACWLVQTPIQAVAVFVSGEKPKTFTEGEVADGLTGISLPIESIFSTE